MHVALYVQVARSLHLLATRSLVVPTSAAAPQLLVLGILYQWNCIVELLVSCSNGRCYCTSNTLVCI